MNEMDPFEARLRHAQILESLLQPGAMEQLGAQAYKEMAALLPQLVAQFGEDDAPQTPDPNAIADAFEAAGDTTAADRLRASIEAVATEQAQEDAALAAMERRHAAESRHQRAARGLPSDDDIIELTARRNAADGPLRDALSRQLDDIAFRVQAFERGVDDDHND